MASPKRRIQTSSTDWRKLLSNIHQNTVTGTIEKLFEDDYFVFEVIKVLHEDSVDVSVKMEFLNILEQYGCDHLDTNSFDQVVSLLLDLLRDYRGRLENLGFASQLLLTTTTFIIQNDLMKSELCTSLVTMMWEMVSKTNDIPTRRLRGCACQCLKQLEMWSPSLLLRYKDHLVKFLREERTDVFQDYASLLSSVLTNIATQGVQPNSISAEDIVPHLSYLMDNAFLFTPEGLWPIVLSVMGLVKSTVHVAPTIFKPLILHNMATFDPCLLHIDLYIQNEFRDEILTKEEEAMLQRRLISNVQLLSLPPAVRLLMLQWLKSQIKLANISSEDGHRSSPVSAAIQQFVRPSVFDSLDIHVDKLTIRVCSFPAGQDGGLINDVHYLKRLTLTTGKEQAAVGLYRVLYASLQHHKTQAVSNIILKITQDLVVDYPHLIPVILDFLLAVKEIIGERAMYVDTLLSLHSQVLNSSKDEVLLYFRFFLQVLCVTAQQHDICQSKTLGFLLGLARHARNEGRCTWELGNSILATCRNMLLHHSASCCCYEMGELLLEMMTSFTDSEVSNRARLLYALLTSACDDKIREVLGTKLLGGITLTQNITFLLSESFNPPVKTEILYIDEAVVHWKRISLLPHFTLLDTPSNHIRPPDLTERLESYYKHLSHLHTELVCQYSVFLDDSIDDDCIFAVTFEVDVETDAFEEMKKFYILSLSKSEKIDLKIQLVPKLPKPCMLRMKAVFFTENRNTVSCPMAPIELTVTDLAVPVPWEHLGVADGQDRHLVFDDLWKRLTRNAKIADGVESLQVVKCTRSKLREMWAQYNLPALHADDSQKAATEKFVFFLPPSFHLLFKVYTENQTENVNMATDFWRILPHANAYLTSLSD